MLSRDEVLISVLALPPGDREDVAAALQDSLDAPSESGALLSGFYEELQRRSTAYRAGNSRARPAAEVMSELFQKQTDETGP